MVGRTLRKSLLRSPVAKLCIRSVVHPRKSEIYSSVFDVEHLDTSPPNVEFVGTLYEEHVGKQACGGSSSTKPSTVVSLKIRRDRFCCDNFKNE